MNEQCCCCCCCLRIFFALFSVKFSDCDNFTVALSQVETVTSDKNSECDNGDR